MAVAKTRKVTRKGKGIVVHLSRYYLGKGAEWEVAVYPEAVDPEVEPHDARDYWTQRECRRLIGRCPRKEEILTVWLSAEVLESWEAVL